MASKGSGSGSQLVYVEPQSVRALQDLARTFRTHADGKALKKELNKRIKDATKPIVSDMQANARSLAFTKNSGARARRTAGLTKTGRVRKGKGLRTSLAAGIKTEISYRSGAGAGVRIRLKSSDTEVNQLGAALNRRGKIRHPLFGNTDYWYDTTASNAKDWFYRPVDKHRAQVVAGVKEAIDDTLRQIARDIG